MKDKILVLIKASRAIKDSEKAIYSKLLDFIDEERQKKLLEILENEVASVAKIEAEAIIEKSEINGKFVAEIDDFFKKEEKKAIKDEESEEKEEGENIQNQLNEA